MFGFIKKALTSNMEPSAASQVREGATTYEGSEMGIARFKVEREFLREYFYRNPTGLVADVTEEYGLHNLYVNYMRTLRVRSFPYKPEHFLIDTGKTERGDYLVIAELPEPEFANLCYRMYFLFNADFSHVAFFTVEREEDGVQLYLWDENKQRVAIGPIETGRWAEKTKEERDYELQLVNDVFYGVPEEERGKVKAAAPEEQAEEQDDEPDGEQAEGQADEPAEPGEPVDGEEPAEPTEQLEPEDGPVQK